MKDYKTRANRRRQPQQKYSWLGLLIAAALFGCTVGMLIENRSGDIEYPLTKAEKDRMHDCLEQGRKVTLSAWGRHVICEGE